jgi:ABC-type transporter Mla subunit MlaD
MADEETQRTMQFILEQQAQLTVSLGQLTENVDQLSGTVDRLSGTVDRLSEKVDRTADGIAALLTIAEIHEREIEALRETVNTVSESVNAVDERGRETDERLNALINTVERYISERRNGQA